MHRAVERLDQVLDLLIPRSQARVQGNGRDNESLTRLGLPRSSQPKAQQSVDGSLEGISRAPHLVLHQFGDIVVDGKSSSHILMLHWKAS